MDEFDLTREIQRLLILHLLADSKTASRILHYLTDWNKARPLPPAGQL